MHSGCHQIITDYSDAPKHTATHLPPYTHRYKHTQPWTPTMWEENQECKMPELNNSVSVGLLNLKVGGWGNAWNHMKICQHKHLSPSVNPFHRQERSSKDRIQTFIYKYSCWGREKIKRMWNNVWYTVNHISLGFFVNTIKIFFLKTFLFLTFLFFLFSTWCFWCQ